MKTNILASATAGHRSSESYTRFVKFLEIKLVLVYMHRNNKYTMTKSNQKMMKNQVSFFCYHYRPITLPTRIPRVLQMNINIKHYWIPLSHFNFKPLTNKYEHKMSLPLKTNKRYQSNWSFIRFPSRLKRLTPPIDFHIFDHKTNNLSKDVWPSTNNCLMPDFSFGAKM